MKITNNKNFYQTINDVKVPYILKINNLFKSYGKKQVIKNISFQVNRGERIAILGYNGVGKTTLMEMVSLVRQPNSGKIIYNFIKKGDPRNQIGFQFQESVYPGNLRVKNILKFYSTIFYDEIDRSKINWLLKTFGLIELYNKPINSLSGGQKQRLNVLLSIIHEPELLILDELSTGLDIKAKENIKQFIKDLVVKRNLTLILISHNSEEMQFLCDRYIILGHGKIDIDMKKKDVIKKYGTIAKFISSYFNSDNVNIPPKKNVKSD